jgi:hemerythrin superfamily protein
MASKNNVTAIELLEEQHREVEQLFSELEEEESTEEKQALFEELADKLAVHATIEERHFYPQSKDEKTEDLLLESVEEHLAVKRVIADLMETSPEDPSFDAKVKVLKEQVEHHVKEEEEELFPKVEKLLSEDQLIALAQEMTATRVELEEADEAPHDQIPNEIDRAAPIG